MPSKRSPSPSEASPRKRTKRSPPPNTSPSSPPSSRPVADDISASGQPMSVVASPLRPVSWQTATPAEINEALKYVFQLGGHSFDVDVTDLDWRRVAKRLRCCARCEGKGEPCSAASGTELVCNACQRAHKGCSLGIAYRYCLFAKCVSSSSSPPFEFLTGFHLVDSVLPFRGPGSSSNLGWLV